MVNDEKELKKTGDEIPVSAIAFVKDGIARAMKPPAPEKPKAAPAQQGGSRSLGADLAPVEQVERCADHRQAGHGECDR